MDNKENTKIRTAALRFYQYAISFFTRRNFTESFTTNEKAAEASKTNRLTSKEIGARPGIPVVARAVPIAMLINMAARSILLGAEFQKCFLSLTLKIRNIAE